jgi:hypothetical protein
LAHAAAIDLALADILLWQREVCSNESPPHQQMGRAFLIQAVLRGLLLGGSRVSAMRARTQACTSAFIQPRRLALRLIGFGKLLLAIS